MPINKPAFKILDSMPQVGIFEIVEDIFLKDTEDTQRQWRERFFDGASPHYHAQDVKSMVAAHPSISAETKAKFAQNPSEYLSWPRGRVDYDTQDGKWHIMASRKFFTSENIEKVTREFHLPPYASGNIVLEADEGHYAY